MNGSPCLFSCRRQTAGASSRYGSPSELRPRSGEAVVDLFVRNQPLGDSLRFSGYNATAEPHAIALRLIGGAGSGFHALTHVAHIASEFAERRPFPRCFLADASGYHCDRYAIEKFNILLPPILLPSSRLLAVSTTVFFCSSPRNC